MEVDVLCKLRDLSVQDEGEGEDEEDEAINSKREPVSFDEVNALVVQLKSLQVQASERGKDYHTVYLALGDVSNSIWSIYCKHQNIKKAKKQRVQLNILRLQMQLSRLIHMATLDSVI